jgi:hypothetical protein
MQPKVAMWKLQFVPQARGNIAKKCMVVAIFEYSFLSKYGYDSGIS